MDPEVIELRTFTTERHGYDRNEVHAFLSEVAGAVRDLQGEMARLHAELAVSPSAVVASDVGEEVAAVLRTAHGAADALRDRAREDAAGMLAEAGRRVDLLEMAEADIRRRLDDVVAVVRLLEDHLSEETDGDIVVDVRVDAEFANS